MPFPSGLGVVQQLAAQYPHEFAEAHTGGPNTEKFIRRLAWVMHSTVDKRWGLNGKRGDYNTISQDALNWLGEGPGIDPRTGQPITVVDVIAGAGGPNPQPSWQVFDTLAGPGGWIQPQPVDGSSPQPTPTPTPPPACKFVATDLSALARGDAQILAALASLADAVKMANNTADRLEARVAELKDAVDAVKAQSFTIDASAKFIGPVKGTITPR